MMQVETIVDILASLFNRELLKFMVRMRAPLVNTDTLEVLWSQYHHMRSLPSGFCPACFEEWKPKAFQSFWWLWIGPWYVDVVRLVTDIP